MARVSIDPGMTIGYFSQDVGETGPARSRL
jgi:hypothetical protein